MLFNINRTTETNVVDEDTKLEFNSHSIQRSAGKDTKANLVFMITVPINVRTLKLFTIRSGFSWPRLVVQIVVQRK